MSGYKAMALMGLFVSLAVVIPATAYSSGQPIAGLNFRLGDDVSAVKEALHTDLNPEPMPYAPVIGAMINLNNRRYQLRLRTKGIMLIFSQDEKLQAIRLEPPFNGEIDGVKLGDSAQEVEAKLGKPLRKPWSINYVVPMQVYQYVLDDSAYVNFDVTGDGVQYILIGH